MGRMSRILVGSTVVPFSLVTGSTFYYFPELREDKQQFMKASGRLLRIVGGGLRMLKVYMSGPEINSEMHQQASLILKEAIIKNAGVYIKLGQLLATLDVLIPDEYRTNLESLCEYAVASSRQDVETVLNEQWGSDWQSRFESFNYEPIKVGSIAQVHIGVLKNGQKVAVKIQHNSLKESVPGDIRVTKFFIKIAESIFPEMKMQWYADEVEYNLPLELDFELEKNNSQKCQQIFSGNQQLKVPDVIEEMSTGKILTMEYVEGTSIGEIEKLKQQGYDMKEIARLLSDVFAKQIYEDGFVHADPHQGNIFVNRVMIDNKPKTQLILLDHGLYKSLNNMTKSSYASLWRGILTQNEQTILQACEQLNATIDNDQNKEYHKLFAAMVTSRPYEKLMQNETDLKKRMKRFSNQSEKEQLNDMAQQYQKEICQLLQQCNRDLLLLFKVNDFIRSIDAKLGSPINNFKIILKYCYKSYESHEYTQLNLLQKVQYLFSKYWSYCKLYAFQFLTVPILQN